MNRIFYDGISDLPSGGGEQERKDDLWERVNSKNEKIEHLMAQIKQLEHNQDSLKEQNQKLRELVRMAHVTAYNNGFTAAEVDGNNYERACWEAFESNHEALLNQDKK